MSEYINITSKKIFKIEINLTVQRFQNVINFLSFLTRNVGQISEFISEPRLIYQYFYRDVQSVTNALLEEIFICRG